ncbi:MAG: NAD(P)-binding protein [Planctomycetota bacterium]
MSHDAPQVPDISSAPGPASGEPGVSSAPDARHAIIVGYGPVGRVTAEGLLAAGFTLTLIDRNPDTIERQRKLGRDALHGDARDAELLKRAGIHRAETLVLTMPDADEALEACKVAHAIRPEVFIVARANFVSEGILALQHGADHVIIEEVATAHEMRDAVVNHLVQN